MQLPDPAANEARALARSLSLSVTVADLLHRRGFADNEITRQFLAPKLSHLSSPNAMLDRDRAAARISTAIKSGERIAVFGDYDCDGMTSTALLTEVLTSLGGRVTTFLASRYDGGYGLSDAALDRVLAGGCKLLVTCDCGSSDAPRLARALSLGVEAIVIDHHLVPDAPLPAYAFLNPHRPECGFAFKGLASVGLALSLAAALRAALGANLDLREHLDLVAIGTIADVAPLVGDNRALVRSGLGFLSRTRRPGLVALAALASIDLLAGVTSEQVAFRIAPRLNAPGRLGSPEDALALLLEKNPARAELLAARVEQAQEQRRAVEKDVLAAALEQIEQRRLSEREAIVVAGVGWSPGVVGIVAGRLAGQLRKPSVVLGIDTSGIAKGSVRGPRGARLYDALASCRDLLTKFGGHQAAAGLELEASQLDAFADRFSRAFASGGAGERLSRTGEPIPIASLADVDMADVLLDPSDDLLRVVDDLDRVEPFGEGNPAPRLALASALVRGAREVRGGHLKLDLEVSGRPVSGFGPSMASRMGSLGNVVHVVGQLRRDAFRGGGAVEVKIDHAEPAA